MCTKLGAGREGTQGQGLAVLESCGFLLRSHHAGWFARKGPGRSWRLQSQPTQGPADPGSIPCAGMLFLSGALEQE